LVIVKAFDGSSRVGGVLGRAAVALRGGGVCLLLSIQGKQQSI
jgi:hypothetical protein